LFQEVLEESSLTLPRWGLMRNGELSERIIPEHLTNEIESGFWPTPAAMGFAAEGQIIGLIRMCENQKQAEQMAGSFRKRVKDRWPTPTLQIEERKTWATPTASEVRQGWQDRSRGKKGQQESPFTQVIKEAGGREATSGLHLNPDWTEWLMGWPIGWTDSKPLETDKFQQWWNSHGERLETVD